MNILLTCRQFNGYHGTCLYFFDLAVALKKLGHNVMVLSDIKGSDLHERLHRQGVEAWDFKMAPNRPFDIILASHKDVITNIIQNKLYAPAPIVSINHSELYEVEFPVIHARVIHYIAIRESIEKLLTGYYMVDPSEVSVIYNPINEERLLSGKLKLWHKSRQNILFPGSIDMIRMQTLLSLYEKAKSTGSTLTVVGQKQFNYLDKLDPDVISVHKPTWDMRSYYSNATHTGSIMMGRTEIEGWFFGLPCYEYIVNPEGEIFSVELRYPPRDMIQFTSSYVAKRIEQLCERLLRNQSQTQSA